MEPVQQAVARTSSGRKEARREANVRGKEEEKDRKAQAKPEREVESPIVLVVHLTGNLFAMVITTWRLGAGTTSVVSYMFVEPVLDGIRCMPASQVARRRPREVEASSLD